MNKEEIKKEAKKFYEENKFWIGWIVCAGITFGIGVLESKILHVEGQGTLRIGYSEKQNALVMTNYTKPRFRKTLKEADIEERHCHKSFEQVQAMAKQIEEIAQLMEKHAKSK